jgi:AcrR family transcriptional regulator
MVMPKAFSDREKEVIKARLVEAGRQYFETYGVRRTNVEDLTRAAGISKGAFYLFYESKEALFLEILMQFEQAFRQQIFANIRKPDRPHRENFKDLLREGFKMWRAHPLLKRFDQEEFQYLVRKLPEGTLQQHFQEDEAAIAWLVEQWREMGVEVKIETALLANLMKALFFVSLHEDDFGSGYQPALETLIDLVAGKVFEASEL